MNKLERKTKGDFKYKKRLKNLGIVGDNYSYKTTGKPCSCAMCSPSKVNDKAKYRIDTKNINILKFFS